MRGEADEEAGLGADEGAARGVALEVACAAAANPSSTREPQVTIMAAVITIMVIILAAWKVCVQTGV